jgi:hypothetical protein
MRYGGWNIVVSFCILPQFALWVKIETFPFLYTIGIVLELSRDSVSNA